MNPEVIVSLALLTSTFCVSVYGKKLQQKDAIFNATLILSLYLALVWLPLGWRNGLTATLIVLIALSMGSLLGGLVFAFITYMIGRSVPGGMSVLLLLLVGLVTLFWVHEGVQHLRRIARARHLEPGKVPRGEVGLGGVVEALRPIPPPLPDVVCAAWWLEYKDNKRHSREPLRLKHPEMDALIDLSGASLSVSQAKTLNPDEAKKFLEVNQQEPFEVQKEDSAILRWIEEGKEVYVIGVPVWESRMESESEYRESAMMPVFRAQEGQPVYLADQPRDEVHRASRWDLALGLVCAAQCAIVIGAQLITG